MKNMASNLLDPIIYIFRHFSFSEDNDEILVEKVSQWELSE